jgi:multidrug efflux pump subunit AcrA (membrane-fusion protein)
VALGQTVSAGAPVVEIVNLEEVDVLCFVPPQIALRMTAPQPARLVAVAGQSVKEPPANGKVVFVAVAAQAETGNFPIKVRFPNKDRKLRANTVVRLQVLTQPEKSRLVVPEAALMEDQEPPSVFVAQDVNTKKNAEGHEEKFAKAHKLFVVLGVRDRQEHLVQVIRLEDEKHKAVPAASALFIIEGGQGLQEGDALKLEEDEHKE